VRFKKCSNAAAETAALHLLFAHSPFQSFTGTEAYATNSLVMKLIDLTPMLETDDVAGTLKFYTELLGFKCVGVHPDAKNPIWACVRDGEAGVMFTTRNEIRREFNECAKPTMTGSSAVCRL